MIFGKPFAPEAYAQGKMLDHSGWRLPRGITPSDIDMVFENRPEGGASLVGELSSSCSAWSTIDKAQRDVYLSLIRNQMHCAVLCKHSVRPELGRLIRTDSDVESYELIAWDFGFVYSGIITGNAHWQRLVQQWFEPDGPARVRRRFLGRSVGLVRAAAPPLQPVSATIAVNQGPDAVRRFITREA
jgi:hypothetical protein